MTAQLEVLVSGYVGERVASTVSLVRDGDVTVIVDPGMVADRRQILDLDEKLAYRAFQERLRQRS